VTDGGSDWVERVAQSAEALFDGIVPGLAGFLRHPGGPALGRERDLYPCPLLTDAAVTKLLGGLQDAAPEGPEGIGRSGRNAIRLLANNSLRALNVLAGFRAPVAGAGRCEPQRALQARAVAKAHSMWHRLRLEDDVAGRAAFHDLVDRDSVPAAVTRPTLRADACDLLESSAQVDPLLDQPPSVQRLLSTPAELFPGLTPGTLSAAPVSRAERQEYAKLVARQLRSGKVTLSDSCAAGAGIFTIGKSNGSLREIWNGGKLSEAAARPLKPPHLANPTPLLNLTASREFPIRVYKRDARCYFDQLRTPDQVRPWLGRPALSVHDLLAYTDLSWDELRGHWVGDASLTRSSTVVPLCCSWPMGFAWSSYLAQSTLLGCCRRAGFGPARMLALDLPTPSHQEAVLALATDDVALFTAGSRRSADACIARVDAEIENRGIQAHRGKDVNFALDANVIGIALCGGTCLCPELKKLVKVIMGLTYIVQERPRVTPLAMAALDGQLAWLALLNRPAFSVLHAVYVFARAGTDVAAELPQAAVAELWLFLALLPWIVGDLTRPWQSHVVSSDASPAYGFGVSAVRAAPELVAEIARTAARPATFIRLDRDPDGAGEEQERPRLGEEVRVPLRKAAFRHVISSRARFAGHAGALEAEAVTLALRWILRSASRHGRRTTLLVDAKAVIGAVARGRSSAPSIRRAIMRTAALAIGGDLLLHVVYVPSEENPADAPSRGKRAPRRATRTPLAGSWSPRRTILKRRAPLAAAQGGKWDRDQHLGAIAEHLIWTYADLPAD